MATKKKAKKKVAKKATKKTTKKVSKKAAKKVSKKLPKAATTNAPTTKRRQGATASKGRIAKDGRISFYAYLKPTNKNFLSATGKKLGLTMGEVVNWLIENAKKDKAIFSSLLPKKSAATRRK